MSPASVYRDALAVKINGDDVTLQVFAGTEGIPTNAEVVFTGKTAPLKVGDELAGRFFNAYGQPIDGGAEIAGEEREIGGPSVNPVRRKQPSELIATGIAGIDLNNTLVTGRRFLSLPIRISLLIRLWRWLPCVLKQIKSFLAEWDCLTMTISFTKMFLITRCLRPHLLFYQYYRKSSGRTTTGSGYGFNGSGIFCCGQERKSTGFVNRYDSICRCIEYRIQPYGSDSV